MLLIVRLGRGLIVRLLLGRGLIGRLLGRGVKGWLLGRGVIGLSGWIVRLLPLSGWIVRLLPPTVGPCEKKEVKLEFVIRIEYYIKRN